MTAFTEAELFMKDVSWRAREPRNIMLYSPNCGHIIPRKNTRAMAHLVPGGWSNHFCAVCKRPITFICVQNSDKATPLIRHNEARAAYMLIAR